MSENTSTQTEAADDAPTAPASSATEELDTDEKPTVRVDHGTPRLSATIAVAATLLGVVLTAPFNLFAAPFGVAGVGIVAGALFLRDSRGYHLLGVGLALIGALITGAYGAVPPELLLVSVSSLLVAWDAGQHGISVGNHLGRNMPTRRVELVHVGLTMLVIALVDVVAFGTFVVAGGGRPEPGAALVIIGAIALIWMLRT